MTGYLYSYHEVNWERHKTQDNYGASATILQTITISLELRLELTMTDLLGQHRTNEVYKVRNKKTFVCISNEKKVNRSTCWGCDVDLQKQENAIWNCVPHCLTTQVGILSRKLS